MSRSKLGWRCGKEGHSGETEGKREEERWAQLHTSVQDTPQDLFASPTPRTSPGGRLLQSQSTPMVLAHSVPGATTTRRVTRTLGKCAECPPGVRAPPVNQVPPHLH